VLSYSSLLQQSANSALTNSVTAAWINGLGFRSDLGLGVVLTVSIPVYRSGLFIGVLGMDFTMEDIQSRKKREREKERKSKRSIHFLLCVAIDQTIRQTSYGFVTNIMGDAIVHPRLNTGRGTWSTSG
jgi:hypothetical protein